MPTYRVTGNVQHVGFRRYVAQQARELGVSATAENLDDGSVRVTGDARIAPWLREGPGRIDAVKEEKEESEREDLSTKSVTIVDNGNYTEMAVTLAKSFGQVNYYTPRSDPSFPTSNSEMLGYGLPGVNRINDIWAKTILDETDLWAFFDVYDGNLQLHLQDLGKRVWGSRNGDELELNRPGSKKHLKEIGFNVGPYKVLTGIDNLREWLRQNDDQYVKISRTRGDMETFYSKNYKLIEPRINKLQTQLGAKGSIMQFVVEASIPDAVEIAYDGYTIDGQFPSRCMLGIEVKDKGYVGFARDAKRWPDQIKETNALIAPTLKSYQYRNFLSIELRVDRQGKAWAIDPCCRVPAPPHELDQLMYSNLAEIVWHGADGKLVEPELAGKVGAELLIHSTWAEEEWQPVNFPEKLRDNIKLRRFCRIGKQYYCVPQWVGVPEVGALVAVADTMEEAIEEIKRLTKEVSGYGLETADDALDEAQNEIEKLAEFGVKL